MLDAVALKQRYQSRWFASARREMLVWWLLNRFYNIPGLGFIADVTGLGAGSTDYLPRGWRTPEEAFDLVVYRLGEWKPVAYIDVTGVYAPRDLQAGRGLCVGVWKKWKAEKLNIPLERVWIVHVEDDGPRLRWLQLSVLDAEGETYKLRSDERPYICLDSRRWRPTTHFLKWLQSLGGDGPAGAGVQGC